MTFPATIPIVENEWLTFKARVLDRAVKASSVPPMPPFFVEMLHNAFYAGALTLFALEQKATDTAWRELAGQIEEYYHEAVRRASEARGAPPA